MKTTLTKIVVLALALLAFGAANAEATSQASSLVYKGVRCDPWKTAVICYPASGYGYDVLIDRKGVMVTNASNDKIVFFRDHSQAGK